MTIPAFTRITAQVIKWAWTIQELGYSKLYGIFNNVR